MTYVLNFVKRSHYNGNFSGLALLETIITEPQLLSPSILSPVKCAGRARQGQNCLKPSSWNFLFHCNTLLNLNSIHVLQKENLHFILAHCCGFLLAVTKEDFHEKEQAALPGSCPLLHGYKRELEIRKSF